ncbi:hypothetical protein Tco_1367316 [Tanacetum coccineum]
MAIPTNMTAAEAQNLRLEIEAIEQSQKHDDSTYESDYRSGYNSDNSGQSSLHGKRRVWDDLRDVKAEPPEFIGGRQTLINLLNG